MPPRSRPSSTASTDPASPLSPSLTASPSSPRKRAFILPKPSREPPAGADLPRDPAHLSIRAPEPARVQFKRQQTQNACTACRKRKSKCNGARPSCTSCTRKRTRCFFDPDREGGQVASLRRRHDVLEDELRAHRALYAALRSPDLDRARELLPRIRAAADVHDAVGALGLGVGGVDVVAVVEGEGERDGNEEWGPGAGSPSPRLPDEGVRAAPSAALPPPPPWDEGAPQRGGHGPLGRGYDASAPTFVPVRAGVCSLPDIRSFCSGARCAPWVAAGGFGGRGEARFVDVAGRWA